MRKIVIIKLSNDYIIYINDEWFSILKSNYKIKQKANIENTNVFYVII